MLSLKPVSQSLSLLGGQTKMLTLAEWSPGPSCIKHFKDKWEFSAVNFLLCLVFPILFS